jgi:tetratricopeptide (TPR) repeat protein
MKRLTSWALAALVVPLAAAAPWSVARSEHFEVWSNAPADTAREIGAGLERLRTFFIKQVGIEPRTRVRVICFASLQEFADYRVLAGSDGFSLTGPRGDYIVTHTVPRGNLRVPAHEYAHLLIHASGWKLPEWLAEGISEVVSSVQFGDRASFIGGDLPGRSQQLKTATWMRPAELFAASRTPEETRDALFYAQSWALAHMLIVSPEYAPRFPAFLSMVAQSSPTPAAIEGVYGVSTEAFFREARNRVLRGVTGIPLPPVADAEPIRVESASAFDARVMLAGLRHAAGQTNRAEAAYRELAAERPNAPEIPAALGLIALGRGDHAGATQEFGRALSLGLRDADLCFLYAAPADQHNLGEQQIRGALERAIAIRPDFDDAHFKLGLIDRNTSHAAEAVSHFRAMRPPAPDRAWLYYSALSDALLELGQRTEARDAAIAALRYAATDRERQRARTLVYFAETETSVEIAATPDGRREFRSVRVPVNAPAPNPFIEVDDDARSVAATLDRVDCAGDAISLIVTSTDGTLELAVPDPSRVQIRNAGAVKFELTCGPQQSRPVLVEYTAQNILRGLELR